jgi:hypothetical protein
MTDPGDYPRVGKDFVGVDGLLVMFQVEAEERGEDADRRTGEGWNRKWEREGTHSSSEVGCGVPWCMYEEEGTPAEMDRLKVLAM